MHYYFYGTCYNFYSVFKNNMDDLLKLWAIVKVPWVIIDPWYLSS
jgi:hypothetical protein